ncbi:uncharacterized protein [Hyperolius riggenbachi]|uniref:uncharacterized protein n=1 Tax=Hyperolius riggenbachi TaxID=752182 RepID=UPI0035A3A71D
MAIYAVLIIAVLILVTLPAPWPVLSDSARNRKRPLRKDSGDSPELFVSIRITVSNKVVSGPSSTATSPQNKTSSANGTLFPKTTPRIVSAPSIYTRGTMTPISNRSNVGSFIKDFTRSTTNCPPTNLSRPPGKTRPEMYTIDGVPPPSDSASSPVPSVGHIMSRATPPVSSTVPRKVYETVSLIGTLEKSTLPILSTTASRVKTSTMTDTTSIVATTSQRTSNVSPGAATAISSTRTVTTLATTMQAMPCSTAAQSPVDKAAKIQTTPPKVYGGSSRGQLQLKVKLRTTSTNSTATELTLLHQVCLLFVQKICPQQITLTWGLRRTSLSCDTILGNNF